VIERQSAHLGRLVDDLLDITRIARGKIELRRQRVDLRDVAMRAADDLQALMQARGLELRVDVPPARVWADADATRVTQVIGNLLHNAAKFTSRGGTVELALRRVDDHAEISVRDTGAGIDGALLPHLFDAFVQGERTLARSEGGLGLGLALVKGIAELHDGSVRAESAGIGEGATFVVRLPLAKEAGASQAPEQRGRDGHVAPSHVLVVDDNRDGADSLAELLTFLGHHVDVAYDGPSALEKIRTDPPNVVVCDLGLPGMSGYDIARTRRVPRELAR
jgi:two-component sensor histidine kinase